MRRSWTFTRRIGVAFVASWGVAIALLVTSLLAVQAVHLDSENVHRELALLELEVDRLRTAFQHKVAHARSFVLSREPLIEEQMKAERASFLATAERLRLRMQEHPGSELLEDVMREEREHEEAVQKFLWTQPPPRRQEAEGRLREQVGPARLQVDAALEQLARYSDGRMVQSIEQELLEHRRARELILTALVLGLLGMMSLAWVLVRKLRPLHREAQDSEQRFRLLVEGVQDYALCLLDAQGRVASWNPGAERIKGWKTEEVLGRPMAIFYTPEAVAAGEPERDLARAERDGRLRTEGWRLRKDGTRFWAEVIYSELRDERGGLKGFTQVLRDVTERRRAERTQRLFAEAGRIFNQLLESELTVAELVRLLVPELADGCILFMLAPGGQWLQPRAVKHASLEKEQLLREMIQSHPPHPEALLGASWVVHTGRSERIEKVTDEALEQVAADEEHLRMIRRLELTSVLTVPLKVGEQTLGALVLLSSQPERLFTVSDQVFMEELAGRLALALDNARLFQETQQALELIGVASHDLGNPLNALQLLLTRLQRVAPQQEPQRVREGLEAALRQSQRLGELLHNLLDLSRLSSGKLMLDISRMEFSEVVREVVERHGEQALEAGCRLSFEAEREIDGWWDRLRLERVVTNLLSNALKFGRGKPIEIRVEQVEGRARLMVRDHGMGIPQEAQRRIFERFAREKSAGRHAGFGLGLYIVRQLVEAHGGTIRVESAPGQGALFTVELPRVPQPAGELEPGGPPGPH
ncbi:sensor histidine kinase [Hyalangium sp.]|uniref:sensor histidine kinase n=1 Tax=Hyalangium sp. TaxID=2028555 RepID=UPI002D313D44|nr:ATP-binding protein [Hyalangium sp.]HYI02655.1 ATP-binding protein [Hyalangium sp.]